MGATVNLRRCLLAMQEELSGRLGRSTQSGFGGSLTLAGEGESVSLEIAGGQVRVTGNARQSAHVISAGTLSARLILGAEEPAVLAMQGVNPPAKRWPWLRRSSPNSGPCFNRLDGY